MSREGENTGAIDGDGVYLTSLTPDNNAKDVLLNNYFEHFGFEGRTAKHIRIPTSTLDPGLLERSGFSHDAYVYRDQIDVSDCLVPYHG